MTEDQLKNMDTRDKLDKVFIPSPSDEEKTMMQISLYDSEGEQVSNFGGIAVDAQDISGNDTTTYANVSGFKSMEDGAITVVTAKGNTRVLQVFEGVMEAISITKFKATGSDVSGIRIYYNK